MSPQPLRWWSVQLEPRDRELERGRLLLAEAILKETPRTQKLCRSRQANNKPLRLPFVPLLASLVLVRLQDAGI